MSEEKINNCNIMFEWIEICSNVILRKNSFNFHY